MKNRFKFFCCVIFTLVILFSPQVNGQIVLFDNFDYSSGDQLVTHNWLLQGTTNTNPITLVPGSLNIPGFPGGTTGNAVSLTTSGQDLFRGFEQINTGTIYASFLVKVTSAASTGDIFFSFKESPTNSGNTNFRGRVFIKADNSDPNKIYFGISKSGTAGNYTTESYELNTTYMIVVKYSIVQGASNDEASLFVNSPISVREPAAPSVSASDIATEDFNIGSVLIRQGTAGNAPEMLIDGIHVARTWRSLMEGYYNTNPVNGEINVLPDIQPEIKFEKTVFDKTGTALTPESLSGIIVFRRSVGNSFEPVIFSAALSENNSKISLHPNSTLFGNQNYEIFNCDSLSDEAGNKLMPFNIAFTTNNGQSLTLNSPSGGGKYYSGQKLTVAWTEAGLTNINISLWASDLGSGTYSWIPLKINQDATAGNSEVTLPADVIYSTVARIRISDSNNEELYSDSPVFKILHCYGSIQELKEQAPLNDIVVLSGEAYVSFITNKTGKQFYIQDQGSGLFIFDNSPVLTTDILEGDKISNIEGKLTIYYDTYELRPTKTTVEVLSHNNTIIPQPVTLSDLYANSQKYQSMLVSLRKCSFVAADGITGFNLSTDYSVSDGTTAQLAYRPEFPGLYSVLIPSGYKNLLGLVVKLSGTSFMLSGRRESDIQPLSTGKAILSFQVNVGEESPMVDGLINEAEKTIEVKVPEGTDISALTPAIYFSEDATSSPEPFTTQNFSAPFIYKVTAQDGTEASYTVNVSFLTGISKGETGKLKIYPVPAGDLIRISGAGNCKKVEILSISGSVLKSMEGLPEDSFDINLSGLSSGLYFIRMTGSKGSEVMKFIKK